MSAVLNQAAALSPGAKLAVAVLGIVLINGAFRLLKVRLPRHFGQADARYRVRKFVVFVGYVVVILFLAVLFEDRLERISLALGVAGAGVVVALQDVIASFAGWFAITFSKLYIVGDRIQLGDIKGDVVDISTLRTTLLETGNWVSKDLHSGRIARIPNNLVLKGPVFNYTHGFRFVWDEIKILLTAQSDHRLARTMLLGIAEDTVAHLPAEAERAWRHVTDNYHIESPGLKPTVAMAVNAGCLEFTLNYIVDHNERTAMKDRLFTKIADEIAMSNGWLDWACPSTASHDPNRGDDLLTLRNRAGSLTQEGGLRDSREPVLSRNTETRAR
jgi:small-conductance mechanosensitive channel